MKIARIEKQNGYNVVSRFSSEVCVPDISSTIFLERRYYRNVKTLSL